jgi:hypothetical protein
MDEHLAPVPYQKLTIDDREEATMTTKGDDEADEGGSKR